MLETFSNNQNTELSRKIPGMARALAISFVLASNCISASYGADAVAKELSTTNLNILENRFFNHLYGHDPVEKRLERLECLVFGQTKGGSNNQRLEKLMDTVTSRSQQPLPQAQDKNIAINKSEKNPSSIVAKPPASSNQYPVLNTLEWRALKKTFPAESLDQRLDRLESKLFGQPAQTMAYIDRVDRLKKTLGIELGGVSNQAPAEIGLGPAPKARPRGDESPFEGFMPQESRPRAFSENPVSPFGASPFGASPFGMSPFGANPFGMSPLGGIDPFGDGVMDRMRQLMKELQGRQFAEMDSQHWVWDPKTRSFVEMNTGKRLGADGRPLSQDGKPRSTAPGAPATKQHEETIQDLPGYADPNSI